MRVAVVGGGSWGTCFACLLRDRGHEPTLACRDPEQVRAIEATGHNPRYLTGADLRGVAVATIENAPIAESELVVLALPSRALAVTHPDLSADTIAARFRMATPAVLGRVHDGRFLLDLRGIDDPATLDVDLP